MVNQKDGFDCPGCAWPDPEHRTSFEFCENGAKAVADEAMKANVNPCFFKKYSIQDLLKKSDHWLNKQGRISHPMVLKPGNSYYETISWDSAFDMIGDVQEYEQDNFGEVHTDFSSPESVANMWAYVQGWEIIHECYETVRDELNDQCELELD